MPTKRTRDLRRRSKTRLVLTLTMGEGKEAITSEHGVTTTPTLTNHVRRMEKK